MTIANAVAKRGNEWIPRYLLTEENSEFIEFLNNPKHPSELTAVFRVYSNEASKKLNLGPRTVKVVYNRLDLKALFVHFKYNDAEEFYAKALDEVNKVIEERYGSEYLIPLEDIDIKGCQYGAKMSTLAVKSLNGFWFDRCIITNQ